MRLNYSALFRRSLSVVASTVFLLVHSAGVGGQDSPDPDPDAEEIFTGLSLVLLTAVLAQMDSEPTPEPEPEPEPDPPPPDCVNDEDFQCGTIISPLRGFNVFSIALPQVFVPSGSYPQGTTTEDFSKTLRRRFTMPDSETYFGRVSWQVSSGTIMDYEVVKAGEQDSDIIDPEDNDACSGSVTFVSQLNVTSRTNPGLCNLSPNGVYFLDLEISPFSFAPDGPVFLENPLVINGSFGEQLAVLSQ